MAGIDQYTELMIPCDGTDASTTYTDYSGNARIVYKYAPGNAQLDTAQKVFGTASSLHAVIDDSVIVADFPELDVTTQDFAWDFRVRFASTTGNIALFGRTGFGNSWTYCAVESGVLRFRDWAAATVFDMSRTWNPSADTWYHVTISRDGTNFRMFIDGTQLGATEVSSASITSRSDSLEIGYFDLGATDYVLDGWIDEFRFSVGVPRWTTDFTPPTEAYSVEITAETSDTASLDDTWTLSPNPKSITVGDTASLDDAWALSPNPESKTWGDTASLDDSWALSPNPESVNFASTASLDDTWTLELTGDLSYMYDTNLQTKLALTYKYITNLTTQYLTTNKYDTSLTTKFSTASSYNTDLRVLFTDYDDISAGNLADIVVKLDGSELTDVDYSTLRINYNLNQTPSSASFQLARRHDNLNYLLDGTTASVITNENKIEIYDGAYKLLTAYITKIDAMSTSDSVAITAEDLRYKLSRNSMEIEYGGKIEQDDDNEDIYNTFKKDIGTVLEEVLSATDAYTTGRDSVPFSTTHVPEYTEVYNSYSLLLDTLLRQVANVNWYIDENERLRFQKIDSGTIKELRLSSLDGTRHVYDVLLSDVQLNKQNSGYAKTLNVKLGKDIKRKWTRRWFSGWMNSYVNFFNTVEEKTTFAFQQWGNTGKKWYCGIFKTIHNAYNDDNGWILKSTLVLQYKSNNKDDVDLDDVTVGSGSPQKTLNLQAYGRKSTGIVWEERVKKAGGGGNTNAFGTTSDEGTYLCKVREDSYDQIAFATDFANFDLSQNNKLQTSGTASLLLNAYKYHNISLSNRINFVNTIGNNIYKNNNGFPLHISGITIDCSTRMVTLKLSNYGKSWGVKTADYLQGATSPDVSYYMKKEGVKQWSQGY